MTGRSHKQQKEGPADPTSRQSGASNTQYKRQRANYDATLVESGDMARSDYIVKHNKEVEKKY